MSKTLIGNVCSDKLDKTIVVRVQTRKQHPLYRKQYTVSKKFMADDPKNEAKLGDRVSIVSTRPLSAHKHHRLERVIEKAPVVHTEPAVEVVSKPKPAPRSETPAKETKA